MLKIRFAANKNMDDVILVVLIPLLDPLPPLVGVGEGRLVGDVISDNDGVGAGVVKLSFDSFNIIGMWFHKSKSHIGKKLTNIACRKFAE